MSNGDTRENFILRLFDTIRESNNAVKSTMSKQTDAIDSLVKEGVKNEELKEIIKEHSEKSEDILQNIRSRINIMIACVVIAFTIVAVSYLFVRSSIDNTIHKKIDEHFEIMEENKKSDDSKYFDLERKLEMVLRKMNSESEENDGHNEQNK